MPTNSGSKDEPMTVTFEALTTKTHTTRHKSARQKPLSERGHIPPSGPWAPSPRLKPHRPSRQQADSASSPTDKGALPQPAWATMAWSATDKSSALTTVTAGRLVFRTQRANHTTESAVDATPWSAPANQGFPTTAARAKSAINRPYAPRATPRRGKRSFKRKPSRPRRRQVSTAHSVLAIIKPSTDTNPALPPAMPKAVR